MAFPADPLAIRAEMQIAGTWTDITNKVRNSGDITISGGFAPEQTTLTPCTIDFTLNNRDGRFTDDNINSPYYGQLPTNTPFRVSTLESVTFMRLYNKPFGDPTVDSGWSWDWAQTDDKAVLDVTGDLDLRIEIEPDVWQLGSVGHQLAGKYTANGNQRSWAWVIQSTGYMRFYWSTDGNNAFTNGTYADSTVRVPAGSRIALRVTIDVNNGASGRTITFYTSDSITGTWTQLGAQVVQSGTTSIFSSSAKVDVGALIDAVTAQALFVTDAAAGYTLPIVGRVYRFLMYNGINGTLVADFNPAGRTEGINISWSDGLPTPNTWGVFGTAEISKADYRGYGEIAEMPQDWDISGTDFYVQTQASGITRRLTQGASALPSPIFRNLRQYVGNGALSYWPLEGGSQTTSAGNAVPRGPAMVVNSVQFSSDSSIPGSAGVLTLSGTGSYMNGGAFTTASTGTAFLIFYIKIPSTPGGTIDLVNFYLTGTQRRVCVQASSTTYNIVTYDSSGAQTSLNGATFGATGAPGQWLAMQLKCVQNGGSVDFSLAWYPLGTRINFFGFTATVASSTVGAPVSFATASGAASAGCSFAHVMFGNKVGWEYATAAFAQSSIAYDGERAATRYLRVCREEGVTARVIGWIGDSEVMGPQPIATLMSILDECAAVESSLHFEARDLPALYFRTRASLYGQTALTLTYETGTTNHLSGSFRPTQDDRLLRNRVTVTRPTGAFAVYEKTSGVKSSAAPPNGVGLYDVPLTRNAGTDARLPQLASWEVGKGTWPDRRVPNVTVELARSVFASNTVLTRQMRSIVPGARLQVTNTPAQVGGATADMLIRGFREVLRNRGHELSFSTEPYGPYDAGRYATSTDTTNAIRYDVRTSTLQASMTSGATLAQVASSNRNGFWSWKSIPYNVRISGQVNTVIGATRPDHIGAIDTSFESGSVSGWTITGGTSTAAASTAQKPYGTYSALLTVAGAPATMAFNDATGSTAVVGGSYQVIAWVRCSLTRNVGVYIDWYTSGNVYISTSSLATACTANTWKEIYGVFTAPATAAKAYQGVYLDGSPANGTTLYVKNIDLQRLDSRNARQLLLLTRGTPTKALSSGAEVHIYPQKGWAL